MRRLFALLFVFFGCLSVAEAGSRIDFNDSDDIDTSFERAEHSFPGNLAQFVPSNIYTSNGRAIIYLNSRPSSPNDPVTAAFSSGELIYKGGDIAVGRVEARLKPACTSGTVSGFFLYRGSPWQEIDFEFLGDKPTKVQTLSVNGVNEAKPDNHEKYMPKVIELGFNVCENFHHYAIEWDAQSVRFYVDGRLIDERLPGPYGLPHLPMTVRFNLWPTDMDHWVGPLDVADLPTRFEIDWVKIDGIQVTDWLRGLDLGQKASLLSGTGFGTKAIPNLNIPNLEMTDGPAGVRFGGAQAFPVPIALAATFNRDLAQKIGAAMGDETIDFGKDILLAPTVNIARIPIGGRAFESFGEDPYLSGEMAAQFITGVQDRGVSAVVKHFALNDQEYMRFHVDIDVDETVFRELYLPPFKKAVDAGVDSVMTAYNKVRGKYASENPELLDILRNDWGFNGLIMSDWGAVHSTLPSALAGLDLEMPGGEYFGAPLEALVNAGQLAVGMIDEKVRRILQIAQHKLTPKKSRTKVEARHRLGAEVAAQAMTLLKNDRVLPLTPAASAEGVTRPLRVGVVGISAKLLRTGGGGSSFVHFERPVTSPLAALEQRVRELNLPIEFTYVDGAFAVAEKPTAPSPVLGQGLNVEYYGNPDLAGTPVETRLEEMPSHEWEWSDPVHGVKSDYYSVRMTGQLGARTSGEHELLFLADDGLRVWVGGQLLVDRWTSITSEGGPQTASVKVQLVAGKPVDLKIEYVERQHLATFYFHIREPEASGKLPDLLAAAKALAKDSDVVLAFAGFPHAVESESFDRLNFGLIAEEDALVKAVASVQPNTILVLQTGSPVDLSGIEPNVRGILQAWYPGEYGGLAIADVLLGLKDPGGRLPVSWPRELNDLPTMRNYPQGQTSLLYDEGFRVGYRANVIDGTQPLYAFGHGLSYAKFAFSDLQVRHVTDMSGLQSVNISLRMRNTSTRAGYAVPQIYVWRDEQKFLGLKAYDKVYLRAGQSKVVNFHLSTNELREYNASQKTWELTGRAYRFSAGENALNLPLRVVWQR